MPPVSLVKVSRCRVDYFDQKQIGTCSCHAPGSTAYLSSEFPLERSNPACLGMIFMVQSTLGKAWQTTLPFRMNGDKYESGKTMLSRKTHKVPTHSYQRIPMTCDTPVTSLQPPGMYLPCTTCTSDFTQTLAYPDSLYYAFEKDM